MSSAKYSGLEKSTKFKRRFLPKSTWKKNFIYLLAPIILLLFSAFSLIYIYDAGRLASLIAIPYVVAFVVSVVFLRLSKNYITKKEVSTEGKYLVCLAKVVKEEDKLIYVVYTNGERRHEKHFIEKKAKQLNVEELPSLGVRDRVLELNDNEELLCVKTFKKKDFFINKVKYDLDDVLMLMHIDSAHVVLIPSGNVAE